MEEMMLMKMKEMKGIPGFIVCLYLCQFLEFVCLFVREEEGGGEWR